MTREEYLRTEEKSAEEFETETRERGARPSRRSSSWMRRGDKEQLEVEQQDLTDHIVRLADRSGMPPDEYAQQLVSAGQLPHVVAEVLRGKALAGVLEAARIVDGAGGPSTWNRGAASTEGGAASDSEIDVRGDHEDAEGAALAEAEVEADAEDQPSAEAEPALRHTLTPRHTRREARLRPVADTPGGWSRTPSANIGCTGRAA